jgi:hypothetical protein
LSVDITAIGEDRRLDEFCFEDERRELDVVLLSSLDLVSLDLDQGLVLLLDVHLDDFHHFELSSVVALVTLLFTLVVGLSTNVNK